VSGQIATAVTRPFGPMAQFGPLVHWLEATALGQRRVARTSAVGKLAVRHRAQCRRCNVTLEQDGVAGGRWAALCWWREKYVLRLVVGFGSWLRDNAFLRSLGQRQARHRRAGHVFLPPDSCPRRCKDFAPRAKRRHGLKQPEMQLGLWCKSSRHPDHDT